MRDLVRALSVGAWPGRCLLGVILLGPGLGQSLHANDAAHVGLQVGLLAPASPDLKRTAGTGFNPTFGGFVDWGSREDFALRLRLDLVRFREGKQVAETPGLRQTITTKVRSESLGLEQLFYENRWSMGVGIYAVRWTVASTNHLDATTEVFTPSSSSSWTRLGLSVMGGYQLTKHADVELRFQSSHYGQENQPTSTLSFNLVWTF